MLLNAYIGWTEQPDAPARSLPENILDDNEPLRWQIIFPFIGSSAICSQMDRMIPSGVAIKIISLFLTSSPREEKAFVPVKVAADSTLSLLLLKYPAMAAPCSLRYFPMEQPAFPAPTIPIVMSSPSSDAVSYEYRSTHRIPQKTGICKKKKTCCSNLLGKFFKEDCCYQCLFTITARTTVFTTSIVSSTALLV